MADAILSLHPCQTLSLDSDLSVVLELENPHQMTDDRLTELISSSQSTVEPAVWGYLYGIWESREWQRPPAR
ncbi:hypothetical protein E1N52_42625 [Paraburkholderia guartelaensis]|uniref:Uncharacterized protein n=1 Tax=Paraburkholderia guartelaensis TaxID=2546446 RepID=A0A4R5L1L3_9BURK|nr:hypothetical protein [Paraburkholderia guartelaensis]TDG01893.1 hypothetical protein E1N52_42625 [Paraburkholderia guartelaensis]